MGKEERFNYYINKKDDKDWFIDDRVKEEEITTFKGVVEVLNKQSQRIAELEEQLKNAIVLPIPLNEKCWSINSWVNRDMKTEYSLHENTISNYEIRTCMINNKATLQVIPHCLINYIGNTLYVFATKDEALKKLEELRGK